MASKPSKPPPQLKAFLEQVSDEIQSEYERIRKDAASDPGTAGDEGEGNWAALLSEWLPATYRVETKGRILSADGVLGPQVDVVVLKPGYPKKLAEKKTYIADGVAAAFECKITLKTAHIEKAVKNAIAVKQLPQPRKGSPYRELSAPIVYGLLSHSHCWKAAGSTPMPNVTTALVDADAAHVTHPRDMLDVVCVADLGAWTPMKMAGFIPQQFEGHWETVRAGHGFPPEGGVSTSYMQPAVRDADGQAVDNPFGVMLGRIMRLLGYEDVSVRAFADYWRIAGLGGSGGGGGRPWQWSVYTPPTATRVRNGALTTGFSFDEWGMVIW